MPLDFQLVDVKFTQGMDTRTDKKLVIPGKWNLLRDCNLSTSGALSKRDGVTVLHAATVGNGLATFNDELLPINGTFLSSVSVPGADATAVAASVVQIPGQLGFVDVAKSSVNNAADVPAGFDVAHGLGFTAYVWDSYTPAGVFNGCYVAVLDEATGTHRIPALLMKTTGSRPRVVFSANAFFVFYIDPTGPTLDCRVIRVTAGALTYGVETSLIADAKLVLDTFDACEFGSTANTTGSVGLSYRWDDAAAGTPTVRAIRVTQAAGVPVISSGPVDLALKAEIPMAGIVGLGVCWMLSPYAASGGHFATFIFAAPGGTSQGMSVRMLNDTFASAAALYQITIVVPVVTGPCHVVATGQSGMNIAAVFADNQSSVATAASIVPILRAEVAIAGGVISTPSAAAVLLSSATGAGGGLANPAPPRGPFIVGKPIAAGTWDTTGAGALATGKLLLPMAVYDGYGTTSVNTTNLQDTFFLFDAVSGVVVSKALYGTHGSSFGATSGAYTASSTPVLSRPLDPDAPSGAVTYGLATAERGKISFADGRPTTLSGVVCLRLTPRTTLPPIKAQLGPATYISGGSLSTYDGQTVREVGFPLFPEGLSAVVSNVAPNLLPVGTYSAVAVYEWFDGQGQRHQSAPSSPITFSTTAGQQSVVLTAPTLLISQKTGISIVFFITQAAGTIFNRYSSLTNPILNTVAAATVSTATIAAATSITGISGNELLYNQPFQAGTTLPNNAPGPTSAVAIHQNRLFVNLADRQGAYRYSQQLYAGTGLQWNEQLGGTVPVDGGNIVGFADMDEKMLIFCTRKIYVVIGAGPNLAGGYNNYSDPVEVLSDVGCSSPRSILKMPNGVVFKSTKGFHRVGRDLQVTYIGEATYAYDAFDIMSAVYVEDRKEARFESMYNFNVETKAGFTLVYSYLVDQWSTHVANVKVGVAATRSLVARDAVWWKSIYAPSPLTKGLYVSISLVDGLNRDAPGIYADNPGAGTQVSVLMLARSSFLHLPAMEGFQRVRWMYLTASYAAGASSLIGLGSLVVDFDDVYSAVTPPGAPGSYTTQAQQLAAVYGAGRTIDFRHKLHRQKCKSVAFTFEDYGAFSGFLGITGFEALALEIGAKRGTNKLSAAQAVP